MSVITPSSIRTLSSSLPAYMAVARYRFASSACRCLHTPASYARFESIPIRSTSFLHPAQRYPRLRQLSTQTTSFASGSIADEVPVVLPPAQNAKGKAKAVDGISGDIIGHDIPATSPSSSAKIVPPRRRSIGLKAKKAAISLVSSPTYFSPSSTSG